MITIFKKLQPIKAISFDLDDTLYHNAPVIARAEQAQQRYLIAHAPKVKYVEHGYWREIRHQLIHEQPYLGHDISQLRKEVIKTGLMQLGYDARFAKQLAAHAFTVFLAQRNNITIPEFIKALLSTLQQHYKLIAITNGNADINQFGLADYFEFSVSAGSTPLNDASTVFKMKPHASMFEFALAQLAIQPSELLHVGDSHNSDVLGALRAGCQTAWLDHEQSLSARLALPHIYIDDITELMELC
ncbi:HAD-IA family hydrolase [Flocculibacter collagenilyticus]|uniref:HAD-IA family hydrolase n=1 Tax=Flocculibacter collagenilyticus TaxID=2744479 RepID=UPI0018F7B1FD|nr:HAD-IA family hydrolase [Flocculibacter collagenilyticus]